ncbi:hypothetical protein BDR22DRAFT_88797 [Usnea florida]
MIPYRTITSHWDFIFQDILRERPILNHLLASGSISLWYLARSWSKSQGLVELPASASLVRNTKELLEGDYFDKQGHKDKECLIILVAQKLVSRPRTKDEYEDNTSSPQAKVKQEKQAKIKKEIKEEIKEEIKQEPQSVRPQQYGRPPQTVRRRHDAYQLPQDPLTPVQQPLAQKRSRNQVSSSPDDEIPTEPFTPVRSTDRTVPLHTQSPPSHSELSVSSELSELPSINSSFFRAVNDRQASSGASLSDRHAMSRVPSSNELFVRPSLPPSTSPPPDNSESRTRSGQGLSSEVKGRQGKKGGQRRGGKKKA